jgi:hypothetical protein
MINGSSGTGVEDGCYGVSRSESGRDNTTSGGPEEGSFLRIWMGMRKWSKNGILSKGVELRGS